VNHIYTTEAFIIKSRSLGEANKAYMLLTRELGFIRATAQGVRLDKSKLKGHLSDFSHIHISVVKGKDVWRITSVETITQNPFKGTLKKFALIKNIYSLLIRLLHGEEKNEKLFETILSFYELLRQTDFSQDELKNLEVFVVLHILSALGYSKKEYTVYQEGKITVSMIQTFSDKRKDAVRYINEALEQTHL
jgi:DNA repair protein RecO